MYWNDPIFLILAITGGALVLVGLMMKRFPPKHINSLYGYRTPRAMKSQRHWDFAQAYSTKSILKWGGIMAGLSVVPLTTNLEIGGEGGLIIVIAGVTLLSLMPLIQTERALKAEFME